MKSLNFLRFFLLTFTLVAMSCSGGDSSSDDGGGSNNNNGVTSINLTADKTNVEEGETVTFTVKNNSNEVLTEGYTIKVEGQEITGNTWTATTFGVYGITATYSTLTSNTVTVQVQEPLTSIILSTDSDPVYQGDDIVFAVVGNNDDVLTSQATITYNGNNIGGNVFTTSTVGTHEFVATYDAFTSNTLQVEVLPPPTKFNQRVLIEDYTGTWCGYCPRVSYAIEQVKNATSDVSIVAVHNGDPMANSVGSTLETEFSITGFPTAKINRTADWTYPEPDNVSQVTNIANEESNVGLALVTSLSGSTMNIEVNAKFGALYNESNSKLVVYIIEDGLVYDQTNYTTYFGGTATISGFTHNEVLRSSLTAVMGDVIPNTEVYADNVYTTTFSTSVPSSVANSANISVVAFVVKSNNQVVNVRTAHFGDTQSFEEL